MRAKTCPRAAFLTSTSIDAPAFAKTDTSGTRLLVVSGNSESKKRVRVVGEGNWPTSTDLWCWHCCHPFTSMPLPMPVDHDDRRDTFHVTGTFCSWACIKAYNLDSHTYKKGLISNTLTLFHKRCTGVLRGIRPAPPRQMLRVFGGSMSIEDFRAASQAPVEYTVLPARMVVLQQMIQETKNAVGPLSGPKPNLDSHVSFTDVVTKNETLRLKRPKPLQNNRNLLERTMGIGSFKTT